MKKQRKLLALTLVMSILLGCFGAAAFAEGNSLGANEAPLGISPQSHIFILASGNYVFENESGARLVCSLGELSGSMEYANDYMPITGYAAHRSFDIPYSRRLTFTYTESHHGTIDISVKNSSYNFSVEGVNIDSIVFEPDSVTLRGNKLQFSVSDRNSFCTFSGKASKEAVITIKDGSLTGTGMFGKYAVKQGDTVKTAISEAKLPSEKYTDVAENAWYENAVQAASAEGLMQGFGNGCFGPQERLTRAQAVQILYAFSWYKDPLVPPEEINEIIGKFEDVMEAPWYYDALQWAIASRVVNGYSERYFGPDKPVTREQLAVMLYRYIGKPKAEGNLGAFRDRGKASTYALDALNWAVGEKLLQGNGDGTLDPRGYVTRVQAAQIFTRFSDWELER